MADRRRFNSHERFVLRLTGFNRCANPDCRVPLDRSFHADHVQPFSKSGRTRLSNGQALCPTWNLRKGAK
jgi:hypothetical protein